MVFLDFASVVGLVLAMILVIFGITIQDGFAAIIGFLDRDSALITFGGAFFTVLAMSPNFSTYLNGLKSFALILKPLPSNEKETIESIITLSNVARKEGLLALEEAANSIEDEFMKKGVLLIVDGTDPELVRSILETVGPSMSVALVTTLYGSLLANWICTPVSNKLKSNNANEIMMKEVMVEGLLSIQAGENPRVIEEKLKSFLSPAKRSELAGQESGEAIG